MVPMALLLRVVPVKDRDFILLVIRFEHLILILLVKVDDKKRMLEADEKVALVTHSLFRFVLFSALLHNNLLLFLDRFNRPIAPLVAAINLLLQLLL